MNIAEIFLSIQGEGLFIGKKQIFIRYTGCNIRCKYCDTPYALEPTPTCKLLANNTEIVNPISEETLYEIIKNIDCTEVVLTGGEPLLQVDKINNFLKYIKKETFIYLETNGILYSQLEKIIDLVDLIAMDIKLPKVASIANYWCEYIRFIKLAQKKDLFIKIVVDEASHCELSIAASIINHVDNSIPVVIQPLQHIINNLSLLLEYENILSKEITNVRILPQLHKLANWV